MDDHMQTKRHITDSRVLEPVRDVLHALHDSLRELYGPRLERLILYGSWARGEATSASDVDVMVVLRGAVRPVQEIAAMNPVAFDLGIQHGMLLSTYPVSLEDFEEQSSALLSNVRQEGIEL